MTGVAGFVVVVDAEVERLDVDRRWRGRGVAERLLRHAEAVIGQQGRWTAWLAVVAGNTRVRRFYTRLGRRDRGPLPTRPRRPPAWSRFPPTDTSGSWGAGTTGPARRRQIQSDPERSIVPDIDSTL